MEVGDIALGVGLAGAVVSALAGYTDFHDTSGHERRTALTHGLTMTTAVVVDAVSLGLRWSGDSHFHVAAVVLASAGYLTALAGSYAGGHLTFGHGTMVNHNAFADGPADYVAVGTPDQDPDGPGAERNAGQGRVQGMAEHGRPMQQVAEGSTGCAERSIDRADCLLEGLGDAVQPSLLADEAVEPWLRVRRSPAPHMALRATFDLHPSSSSSNAERKGRIGGLVARTPGTRLIPTDSSGRPFSPAGSRIRSHVAIRGWSTQQRGGSRPGRWRDVSRRCS
jgi:hypothetical protein